jgi:hypothetical protein
MFGCLGIAFESRIIFGVNRGDCCRWRCVEGVGQGAWWGDESGKNGCYSQTSIMDTYCNKSIDPEYLLTVSRIFGVVTVL